ncbi:two-component system histidine kinase PnpS [Thalassobacillus pellis]|uniref:two-component system histidine kinase PnpS n=1 Tax=Thalassobacillus pellis TaxID=748008 RepID=UPI00195F36B5|nr:ATP-binding protein [Thalassobacillus pellis]MBM7554992.1 two-component system phosphate regulon sensor histidine kinase PhoR [Thalassobacillus pellis]
MKAYSRPLMTYTAIIILVMIVLGLILAQLTRGYFINVFEDRIKNESEFFVAIINNSENSSDMNIQLKEFTEKVDTAVVVFDEGGEADTNTIRTLDSFSDQEYENTFENAQALYANKSDGRLINETFYYPVPVESGTMIMISPVKTLENVTRHIWLLIGLTFALGLILIFLVVYNVMEKYVKPIRSAANVASELAKGNYRARTYDGYFGEAGKLNQSINVLARNLQQITTEQGMQENRLEAVINNMGSGLLLIDEKGYIHLVNRAFLDSFGGNSKDYIGALYYEAIPYKSVHETVKDIFMLEETVRDTFVFPVKIQRKHMEVTGAPIFNESMKWKGIVLVFHDITELKRLEQTRKDFVANVSHELKTPITSIRGFSETLLDGAMKDQELLEQFLTIILKESGRLQSLIKDLLELSKIEKTDFQLTVSAIDISHLLQELMPIIRQNAAEKEITVDMETVGPVMIDGDAGRLKQVFMNLLTNAVNYTPSNGNVDVKVTEGEEDIRVSIADTGYGIPEEDIPRIFERFYRVDKARSRNTGGTGLGLAIVKHIIEAHSGTIEVESNVGEGTIFHVILKKELT